MCSLIVSKGRLPAVNGQTPEIHLSYDASGHLTEVTDANGNTVQYTYDPATGQVASIIQDPSGIHAVTQVTYDVYGNINTVTDPNNHTLDLDFDALNRLVQYHDAAGFLTKYTYDANGNITKAERQADTLATQWQTVQLGYDVLNRVQNVTDPLNRVTTFWRPASRGCSGGKRR